jgi:membrane protease YdiL (CAAX protease family)
MSTPTLYLECLILAATAYPAGFSYSLFAARRGAAGGVSTPFLLFLALPFVVVALAVAAARPDLLALRGASPSLLLLAALLAPVALAVEYLIHGIATYETGGKFLRAVTMQRFWQGALSPVDCMLLGVVVVGEEFFFRAVWLGTLHGLDGFPAALALLFSSVVYGLNHLAYGRVSVAAKTSSGFIYGGIYLLGGESLWLPVITHGLQNLILFKLARERHG